MNIFPRQPAITVSQSRSVNGKVLLRAMGGLLYLAQHSALHSEYPVRLLLRRVGPCLKRGAFRYYEDQDGQPIAFCCWVFVSDAVWSDVGKTGRELDEAELNSGSKLFFPEFLAPFGHARKVIGDLKRKVFPPGTMAHGIRGVVVTEAPGSIRVQRYSSRPMA